MQLTYNFVVSKDSNLAQLRSLSYRYNVGQIIEDNEKEQTFKDQKQIEISDEESDSKKELDRISKKLKESKKIMLYLEIEYTKCEEELKSKKEVVKLKSGNKRSQADTRYER